MDRLENYTVFDSFIDSAIVVDVDGKVCYCNEALSSLCEIPFRQVSKMKELNELFTITPSEILSLENLKNLQDSSPYEEVSFLSTSGKIGKVQISVQPILNSASQKQIVIFLHDVTLEEKLQSKYRSELSQKDKKITEISLLLEISNALTGISDTNTMYRSVAKKLVSHGICDFICHLQFQENKYPSSTTLFSAEEETNAFEFSKDTLLPFKDLLHSKNFQILDKENHVNLFALFAAKIKMEPQTQIAIIPIETSKVSGGVFLLFKSGRISKDWTEDFHLLKSVTSQMGVALESALFFENSITDEMTQLFNKRFLMTRISAEIDRARRTKERLSLVIFDVDHFKQFNDKHGHQIGDLVLKEVARVTKNLCRNYDVAARYGGEEFVLILPNTDAQGASVLAERLRKKIEDLTLVSGDKDLKVTISLGVAVYPEQALDMDALISLADKALYFAKGSGRNLVKIYDKDCESTLAVTKT